MAVVHPFRGFRYSRNVVSSFDQVVTQPYDKTTPSMQDTYYRSSAYNVVRITCNREKRDNPETSYPDAGLTFRKWIDEGVLVRDSAPAIYAYCQEYIVEGASKLQKGFIALLDLQNSDSGIIPHEYTLAAPKQDRLQLMRSLEANEDLIYMLYSDERQAIDSTIEEAISGRTPEIQVKDEYGVIHRLWAIVHPPAIRSVQEAMRSKKLFIADGHHRFETSVNFMKECEKRGWKPIGVESFDKRMVACFNISGGVTILPTHRLVRDLPAFDAPSFLKVIEKDFVVEVVPAATDLWRKMKDRRNEHVFGFYPEKLGQFYLFRLKHQAQDGKDPQSALDVSILHSLILERGMGITASKLEAQTHVDYEREREACIELVNDGKYQAAFFLNPTTAEQVQQIATLGVRMPQKSTDFYPKLLTGLIFMRMNIQKD